MVFSQENISEYMYVVCNMAAFCSGPKVLIYVDGLVQERLNSSALAM